MISNQKTMETADLYQCYLDCGEQYTTDSRDCPPGSIFFALKGASFDGNRFAAAAIEKGCRYAVIDEPEALPAGLCRARGNGAMTLIADRYILVPDVLTAFKEMARHHRRRFSIPVIGITGTNGKTTTKELIAAVLQERYNVMYTQGNFNNDVGVPKTLLSLREGHEIAVVEMGASHPGDIRRLVEYAEPTCGLITNVGRAHLQGFGSFEGVKQTKAELYDFLSAHNALLFLNEGNSDLMEMASARNFGRIISYGQTDGVSIEGHVTVCDPFLHFEWTQTLVPQSSPIIQDTHLIGAYNIDNLLAAIAVGLHFGLTPAQIQHALAHYTPSNNRSQLEITAKNKLVVDAYNANATSMAAAIDNFARIQTDQPKMAILGDMRELGDASAQEHQRVIGELEAARLDQVWLVGEEFMKTDTRFRKFSDVEAVETALREEQPEGYYILIKGSNGIRLYQLPALL